MADTTVKNVSKPIWHLTPLPLSHVNSSAARPQYPRGRHVPTLHSFCLSTISRNFDLVEPFSFAGVHPVLVRRVLSRVRADRGYEDKQDTDGHSFNPDEATIWAYAAMLEGSEAGSFTLAIPTVPTIEHLPPNPLTPNLQHPLNQLPMMFASPALSLATSLLTSLTLDGMDGAVNDQNVQALRFCPHLSVLWMKSCRVSDDGIRLLGAALELPGKKDGREGRGMWKLRAWYLAGCKKVSDKSAKVFAKWPGLGALDLRDTSCTSASMGVLNRTCETIFAGKTPDYQPCTDGLIPLFASNLSPSDTVANLCLTLIKLPTDRSDLVSLNVTPSYRPIPERHLPQSLVATTLSSGHRGDAKYLADGSRVTGTDTFCLSRPASGNAPDDSNSCLSKSRSYGGGRVKEERTSHLTAAEKRRRAVTKNVNRELQNEREGKLHLGGKVVKEEDGLVKEEILEAGSQDADWWHDREVDARSYYAASASTSASRPTAEDTASNRRGQGDGDRRLMLVRVVHEEWYRLSYISAAERAAKQQTKVNWARESQLQSKRAFMVGEVIRASQRVNEATETAATSRSRPYTKASRNPGGVPLPIPRPKSQKSQASSDDGTGNNDTVRQPTVCRVISSSGASAHSSSSPMNQFPSPVPATGTNPFTTSFAGKEKRPFSANRYPRKSPGSSRPEPPPPPKPSPFAPHSRHVGPPVKPGPFKTPSKPSKLDFQSSSPCNNTPTSAQPEPSAPARKINPYAPKSSPMPPSSSPTSGNDDHAFSSSQKRMFEGSREGDGKRRGMKMFSGKAKGFVLRNA